MRPNASSIASPNALAVASASLRPSPKPKPDAIERLLDEVWRVYRTDPGRLDLSLDETKSFLRDLLRDDPVAVTEKSLGVLAGALAQGCGGVSRAALGRLLREGPVTPP